MLGDEKHKLLGEKVEKLDAMGQESETKAAKWVIEEGKENEKQENEKEAVKLEKLSKSRRFAKQDYFDTLVKVIKELFVHEAEIPKGWSWEAWRTKKGIGLTLWTPAPVKILYKAFVPSGEPFYDLAFCGKIVRMGADYIDKKTEKEESTIIVPKSGLVLPAKDG